MHIIQQYPQLITLQAIARKQRAKVYLVGGFLRDYCLKRPNQDLDFAVSKGALKLAEALAKEIKGTYIVLDQERQCARVAKKQKGRLMTFDFANFKGKTIDEDVQARDVTINTLYVPLADVSEETVLDDILVDTKRALKDIQKKKIKRVSIASFRDDPLRMLRCYSLKATLGFKIDVSTLNQIRREKAKIGEVSPERITEELFKILETPEAASILKSMDKAGLLVEIIPQLKVMYECKQGGYHHLDVWPHSIEAVVQLERIFYQTRDHQDIQAYFKEAVSGTRSRGALLKLATLVHDIGKPDTRKKEPDGRLSFHGHEHAGRAIATIIAKNLKLSIKERHFLENIVLYHLRPGYLSNFKVPSKRMVYRFFRDTQKEAVSILLMSLADQRATRGPLTSEENQKHHEAVCRGLVEEYFVKSKETPYVPLLDGNDILKQLKLKPSPLVGAILSDVKEAHVLGKIQNKKEALDLAKEMVKK